MRQMKFLFVGNHITIPRERFPANVAMVVFNTGMGDHVTREIARCYKAFVAHRTQLVTNSSMDFLMGLEISQGSELLRANCNMKAL